ncbi:hypothetical protein Slin15195_G049920 [Septoria linicola]|uniref:Uncharacterized protein n=1 Tax=Septoria linicola TaxID=215465 RepID=A0A9Q9AT57_9PEZI|nr:hypothetical protein Slin14017_G053440 [Septoria linicola]USW51673.1 hypothetical protein Slin15195_G049920 [Septoria linicola]
MLEFITVLLLTQIAGASHPKRDLPVDHGCIPCDPNDAPFYQAAQDAIAKIDPGLLQEGTTASEHIWPANYTPAICAAHAVNCMTSGPGVKWTEVGGLSAPLGRWAKEDGTETIAWGYWQSTLQWVGAGGSATTYNAHCTIFTCVKGTLQADIGLPGSPTARSLKGDGKNDDSTVNNCGCFPADLDADIHFSLFDPTLTPPATGSNLLG